MPTIIDDDEKVERLNNFDDFQPGSLPPEVTLPPSMGGVPRKPLAPSIPLPPATPEHFVCLRGPCKFYLEIGSPSDVENRTLGYLPVQTSRYCRAIAGAILSLDDDAVFACSEWDPRMEDYSLVQRRIDYLKAHPGCSVADQKRTRDRETAIAKRNAEADAYEAEQKTKIAAAEAAVQNETPNVNEWASAPEVTNG